MNVRNNIKSVIRNLSIVRVIFGVLLAILGIYSIMNPETVLINLGIAFALYALISGALDISMYFIFENRFGISSSISIIGGILSILAGSIMMMNPASTSLIIGFLFPLWFMSNCIARIAQLPLIRSYHGTASYWISLLTIVFGIGLSVFLLVNPALSVSFTISYVSIYVLFLGVSTLVDGIGGLNFSRKI